MILRFITSVFVAVLNFGRSLTPGTVKCISFTNEPCLTRPALIDLN